MLSDLEKLSVDLHTDKVSVCPRTRYTSGTRSHEAIQNRITLLRAIQYQCLNNVDRLNCRMLI